MSQFQLLCLRTVIIKGKENIDLRVGEWVGGLGGRIARMPDGGKRRRKEKLKTFDYSTIILVHHVTILFPAF